MASIFGKSYFWTSQTARLPLVKEQVLPGNCILKYDYQIVIVCLSVCLYVCDCPTVLDTVQIANELSIFAGLVRDSCESNACEINAYSFANTRTFREVLHMNQSETRGPRTG